ncbi:MAG: acyltransferase family protein [Actinomycetales bacterium]|nr:acyltransferase family protein [Actinomycetales bacterium]
MRSAVEQTRTVLEEVLTVTVTGGTEGPTTTGTRSGSRPGSGSGAGAAAKVGDEASGGAEDPGTAGTGTGAGADARDGADPGSGDGGGASADAVPEALAEFLAFARRRLTGEYEVDEFGFDRELTERVLIAALRPLYRAWFRVEVSGIENVPDDGAALVVANHSGAIALDALMTQVAVFDEHPKHRHLRPLGADLVFRAPVVGELARKSGATLATNADAERLLAGGSVVGVWPEGFKGVGKPFSERYKLQRFGRGGFVSAAMRTRAPIVPCSIVGAEETYPIIGNMPATARLLGLPYLPVTPTWPWLGPLGLVPLPSKWLIEFSPPVHTEEYGEKAAEDPMLVFELADQVRRTIQQTLYALLMRRSSVFGR